MLEVIEDQVICTKWVNQQGLHTISIAANNWIKIREMKQILYPLSLSSAVGYLQFHTVGVNI